MDSMAAVVGLLLQQNGNDFQQQQQKEEGEEESKREIATTTVTAMLTLRDQDGIVEEMSSPHEGYPQHQVQELSALSPTVQQLQPPQEKEKQEKEWRRHEQQQGQEKPMSSACLDGSAFVSEGVWSKIKPSDDETENVEAQRSRLNAIRNSWCDQFQAPGDPVLIVAASSFSSSPSPSSSPSHKQVRRSNTAHNIIKTNGNTGSNGCNNNNTNNNISKSPSQNTNAAATTIINSDTTPTNSFQRGPLGYNSLHHHRHNNSNTSNGGGGAILDQGTIITWRGLFASVRQLSHDTSTTGSSTHSSSASTTSLSSSAQSLNNIHNCSEKEQVQKDNKHSNRHSKRRNSDDASTIRAIGSLFNRRPFSSFQQQLKGTTATTAFTTVAASSSSTIDLEKRAMMTTKNPPKRLTILVVGDGAVGKSALTLRFLRDQYDPTIEDSYCKHIEVDGQDYTLELTDTAGQSEYRDQWDDQFMRTGDGFICVYSIASMSSFKELVGFRDQIWRAKGSRRVPIVITGNKCDLEEDEREVRMDVGALFAERSNALFVETRQVL
ncbi:hypothetical protein BGW39_002918 [Mortierella sp. 14UC]|nr:hypothetical protein BGW39_002918 [Mortierella sp. 14UC]